MAEEERIVDIRSKVLDEALGRVIHAAGDSDARPILATVLFEGDADGFRLVAADNYRIAIAELLEDDHSAFGRVPVPVTFIPTLRAFLKAHDRLVILEVKADKFIVRDASDALSLRFVDGTYPNYASIIPKDGATLGVNPAYLTDAARATKGLSVLKLSKGDSQAAPFVFEATGYREAIMAIRLLPDGTPG